MSRPIRDGRPRTLPWIAGAPAGPERCGACAGPVRRRRVRILGVSDVTRAIRGAIRDDERLGTCGSRARSAGSRSRRAGHAYFALKDERSQLPVRLVPRRAAALRLRGRRPGCASSPTAGSTCTSPGRAPALRRLDPAGRGSGTSRSGSRRSRRASSAEGLFDPARSGPCPSRPGRSRSSPSPTGAVWKDICDVLARRWPLARVVLVACQVQGDGAAASIVTAFRRIERYRDELARRPAGRGRRRRHDPGPRRWLARGPLVVQRRACRARDRGASRSPSSPAWARGGRDPGRLRGRRPCADPVRGRRARRPRSRRDAGVAPARRHAPVGRDRGTARRRPGARRRSAARSTRSSGCPARRRARTRRPAARPGDTGAGRPPGARPARLDRAAATLPPSTDARLAAARATLDASAAALAVLGPQATLDRGYAIVRRRADGGVVREPADAPGGTGLDLRLAAGSIAATVDDTTA